MSPCRYNTHFRPKFPSYQENRENFRTTEKWTLFFWGLFSFHGQVFSGQGCYSMKGHILAFSSICIWHILVNARERTFSQKFPQLMRHLSISPAHAAARYPRVAWSRSLLYRAWTHGMGAFCFVCQQSTFLILKNWSFFHNTFISEVEKVKSLLLLTYQTKNRKILKFF